MIQICKTIVNNPIKNIDVTGHWTLSLCLLCGLGGGGGAGRFSVYVAVDEHLNVGLFAGAGGGGMAGIAAGGGLSVSVTNAPSIENLKGLSIQVGGQIGEGAGINAEAIIIPNPGEKPYLGGTVGGSFS